jgi:hypothetical protein
VPSTTSTTLASTTSTTETSTSTTSTSSTTSTTLPPVEICTNGTDDDGDALADCVDQDCAGDDGCPDGCGAAASFDVLVCRVTALGFRTEFVTDDTTFLASVGEVLQRAESALTDAVGVCEGGDRRTARRGLKVLAKQMSRYSKRTGGKFGRAAVPDTAVRDVLVADARAVRTLAKVLRRDVICPPGT